MSNIDTYTIKASDMTVTSSLPSNTITINDNYAFTTNTTGGISDWGL